MRIILRINVQIKKTCVSKNYVKGCCDSESSYESSASSFFFNRFIRSSHIGVTVSQYRVSRNKCSKCSRLISAFGVGIGYVTVESIALQILE